MRRFLFSLFVLGLVACQDDSLGFGIGDEADIVAADDVALYEIEATQEAPRGDMNMGIGGDAAGSQSRPPSPSVRTVQDTTSRRAPVLIRRASLDVRVDDYEEATEAIPQIVGQFDAYFAGEQARRTERRVSTTYTIRVAAAQFDSLLAALTEVADVVTERQVTVDDVTEEYVDVEARLRARRAVEAQYVTLLGRASSVEDVVAVQEKLADVREEIESAEGRLRFLRDRAAFSTITLTVYERSTSGGLAGPGLGSRLADAFGNGWQALLSAIVGVVTLWPLWLFLGLLVVAWRAFRRRYPDALRSRRPPPRSVRRPAPPGERGPSEEAG